MKKKSSFFNVKMSFYVQQGEEGERLLCDEPGTGEVDDGSKKISFIFGSGKHGWARGRGWRADDEDEELPWQRPKGVRGKLFPEQLV